MIRVLTSVGALTIWDICWVWLNCLGVGLLQCWGMRIWYSSYLSYRVSLYNAAMYIEDMQSIENCSGQLYVGVAESIQRASGSGLVSHYLNNNPYTDHIAETFVLLLLCILLLVYKIVDIFRKIMKSHSNTDVKITEATAGCEETVSMEAVDHEYMDVVYSEPTGDDHQYMELDCSMQCCNSNVADTPAVDDRV